MAQVTDCHGISLQFGCVQRNMFFFVIDEAAFGVDSSASGGRDYVEGLFNGFNNRRRSRWQQLGGGMVCTSPGGEYSFVETLADQGGDWDATTMVRRITTWDALEQVKPGAHGFLFDRHPDSLRIVEEGVTFQGISADGRYAFAMRANGETVSWPLTEGRSQSP